MNRICNTCNIEIDENNYLKDRTVCKSCYNENRKKTTITPLSIFNNQKLIKSTITMITTIISHPLKIAPMLLLAQETSAKPISCSKYQKKKVTKDQFI